MQVHVCELKVLVTDEKAQQAHCWLGQLFARPPQVFGRSEFLADEGRNPLGALCYLSVSQSQALGPVHLERIRRPVLEHCKRFTRRVRSWEPHIGQERGAGPPYGAVSSHRESASYCGVQKKSPSTTASVIRVRLHLHLSGTSTNDYHLLGE